MQAWPRGRFALAPDNYRFATGTRTKCAAPRLGSIPNLMTNIIVVAVRSGYIAGPTRAGSMGPTRAIDTNRV